MSQPDSATTSGTEDDANKDNNPRSVINMEDKTCNTNYDLVDNNNVNTIKVRLPPLHVKTELRSIGL